MLEFNSLIFYNNSCNIKYTKKIIIQKVAACVFRFIKTI